MSGKGREPGHQQAWLRYDFDHDSLDFMRLWNLIIIKSCSYLHSELVTAFKMVKLTAIFIENIPPIQPIVMIGSA